jgi:polyhydroxyalkanoate synthesis regulator phasin
MLEVLRKSLLAGLGLAVVTREKVMEATRELVEKGKLSREESEALAAELLDEGKKQWQEMQDKIDAMIRQGLESLDIGSRKEFIDLQERVMNAEKRLAIMEDRLTAVEKKGGKRVAR